MQSWPSRMIIKSAMETASYVVRASPIRDGPDWSYESAPPPVVVL